MGDALNQLGINVYGLLSQIINFVLLALILYFFAYKRLYKMLDERSRRVKESMDNAELIKQERARTEETLKAQIEAARKEGQAIVAQAADIGEKVKEEAKQQARAEAEKVIARARVEIDRERQETVDQLRREFADVAILAAEKVVKKSLDKTAHRQLIDEVLKESPSLGKGK